MFVCNHAVSVNPAYFSIAQSLCLLLDTLYINIGNSVHNKQSTVSFKSKKKVRKPESEWFRVENTHEPLIGTEVFQRVQEQIRSRRRERKNQTTQIFAGLVKCADRGWSLRFGTNGQNKTPYSYFSCSYYGQFGKGYCSMHYIRYDVLYAYVLSRLQYLLVTGGTAGRGKAPAKAFENWGQRAERR